MLFFVVLYLFIVKGSFVLEKCFIFYVKGSVWGKIDVLFFFISIYFLILLVYILVLVVGGVSYC